ncbi:MAG: glycosyltransferase [Candidatus Eisenbacteria bacterium]|nr:glycosyltransferase [Candidatus Eisenbacteria bacterium]
MAERRQPLQVGRSFSGSLTAGRIPRRRRRLRHRLRPRLGRLLQPVRGVEPDGLAQEAPLTAGRRDARNRRLVGPDRQCLRTGERLGGKCGSRGAARLRDRGARLGRLLLLAPPGDLPLAPLRPRSELEALSMRGRPAGYILLFLFLAGVLFLVGYLIYALLFRAALPVLPEMIRTAGGFFFGFMCLLLIRYLLMMWFAYLDQVEAAVEDEAEFTPPVSILIPAYNEEAGIEASIRSLLELDYPSYEIIVIDDGSTDATFLHARRMEGRYSGVRVRVLHKRNGGKSTALNMGIQAAAEEIILCMDGDSKLSPSSVRSAVRHFADPEVGAVAGNVKVVNRTGMLTRLQALEYVEGLNMVRRAQAFFRAVNIIPGPIGLFRRRVLMEVGGYESDTFAEDCDLTLRILERGWKIRYEPDAVAFTEAPEGARDLIKQRYRWTRGILQSIKKRLRAGLSLRNHGLTFAVAYLGFEGLIWPAVNVGAHIFLVYITVLFGGGALLVLWWAQLTVLDLVAALYCVVVEEERLILIPYAVAYRLFFALMLDVCKLSAAVEELFSVEMTWGKLERRGRI